jgi:hypothetical protein
VVGHERTWPVVEPEAGTVRLVTTGERSVVLAALARAERRSPLRRWPIGHGRLGPWVVVALPSEVGPDGLATLLARLERLLPSPTVAVARFTDRWLIIEARADVEPVTWSVLEPDATLGALGIPAGAATMPLRELEQPGDGILCLPGTGDGGRC